jgi:hypothetical protein
MSRNGSYAKSMNGIVSFDDGDGTTIEGSEINTETINCNTLTASSIIYTDYIDSNTNTYIQCLSDITFNGEVSASFVPTSNNQLCNKLYVDTVASSGSSILPLTNVFTGTSNTFNNSLITNNIVQTSSSNINFYNTLSSNSIINMFSDSSNLFGGLINICCGTGLNSPTVNILTGVTSSSPLYFQYLNLGGIFTFVKLCNSMIFENNVIRAVTTTDTKDIFSTTTGDITIGKTGKITLGNTISVKTTTIESTGTTDIINLFNNISGTIGQINMAGKFVIKELSIATTSITDNVSLFNNLSGAFGVVKMATNLLFKQSNILSSAVGDVINLFTNLTTGTLNIGTGITTGILNIGTGITTGDIFIGNTTGTTAGALGDITMGNGSNNNNTADNGRVTINKLQIGTSPILRNIRYGSVAGGFTSAVVNFSPAFPSGSVPFIVGNIQSSSTTQVFSLTFSSVGISNFRYTKTQTVGNLAVGGATTESFNWYAWSD